MDPKVFDIQMTLQAFDFISFNHIANIHAVYINCAKIYKLAKSPVP